MTVNRKNIHEKLHYILLMVIAFAMPLGQQFIPPLIIIWALNWLVEGNFADKFSNFKVYSLQFLFIAFYLVHITGMIYTSNTAFGMFDLEIKLSLLIFPLILLNIKRVQLIQLTNIFIAFVLGNLVALITCLVYGWLSYSETGDMNNLLYMELSVFHHPAYFAMYLCLGITTMICLLMDYRHLLTPIHVLLFGFLIPIFSLFTVMLMAKIGIVCLFLILLMALMYLVIAKRKYIQGAVFTLVGICIFGLVFHVTPETIGRIEGALDVYFNKDEIDPASVESTAGRILLWPVAIEVIKENPIIGVGTGDIKDVLLAKYEEKGLAGVLDEKLNAHTQFLQSFAALGIIGFLLLLGGLLIPFFKSLWSRHYIYTVFLLIIIINSLTESILEVQAGVVFYAFFNSLLCSLNTMEDE